MATHTTLRTFSRLAARPSTFASSHSIRRSALPITSRAIPSRTRPFSSTSQSCAKKYTEEHEWIELDAAGEIGTSLLPSLPCALLPRYLTTSPHLRPPHDTIEQPLLNPTRRSADGSPLRYNRHNRHLQLRSQSPRRCRVCRVTGDRHAFQCRGHYWCSGECQEC